MNKINTITGGFAEFISASASRIFIFVGGYGSGKSEISVNTAIALKKDNPGYLGKIVLADLDIINPFYRSADAKQELERQRIFLITSVFTNTNAEVPAVPQEILSVFDQPVTRAVLDIGGEQAGARIVASFAEHIKKHSCSMFYVVNMNRPFDQSADDVKMRIRMLTEQTGIGLAGLINNTNLMEFTEPERLLETNAILAPIAKSLKVSLLFCAGLDEHYPAGWGTCAPDGVLFLRMKRYIFYR